VQVATTAAADALFVALQRRSGQVGLSQIDWIGAITGKGLAVLLPGEMSPTILAPAIPLTLAGIVQVSRRLG
jgi:hypothetical protein